MTAEPWWRSAVFYRIDPRGYQDSDGDGIGDLRGIVQRLDYLQALGVDAIVLKAPFDPAGFDELLVDANHHRIRIVVQLKHVSPNPSQDAASQITEARAWLARGAAGVESLNGLALDRASAGQTFLSTLRKIADGFPGERVVLVADTAQPAPLAIRLHQPPPAAGPELADVVLHLPGDDAAGFRIALAGAQNPPVGAPLIGSEADPRYVSSADWDVNQQTVGMRKITATMLMISGEAVSIDYGQELGLDRTAVAGVPLIMQWTPSNRTPPAAPIKATPQAEVYGAYRPYVPPPPNKLLGGPPQMPDVAISETMISAAADPNSLPGFTGGQLPPRGTAPNSARANVARESGDALSLLNFYRRLAQLHHGNATLRTGAFYLLEPEAQNALVWVRRPPAGARTVASIVVACNVSSRPVTFSLDHELESVHVKSGTLRPLLTSDPNDKHVQTTEHISLPPWSVYIGEIEGELPAPSMSRGHR